VFFLAKLLPFVDEKCPLQNTLLTKLFEIMCTKVRMYPKIRGGRWCGSQVEPHILGNVSPLPNPWSFIELEANDKAKCSSELIHMLSNFLPLILQGWLLVKPKGNKGSHCRLYYAQNVTIFMDTRCLPKILPPKKRGDALCVCRNPWCWVYRLNRNCWNLPETERKLLQILLY
jgi:hypothetical protein